MEIKDFVEISLVQIVEGVNQAKTKLLATGATISSKNVRPLREGTTYNNATGNLVNLVEFDVAVTVNEHETTGGKAGVNIVGLNIGGGMQLENTNQTVSRIKFSIPLTLPAE